MYVLRSRLPVPLSQMAQDEVQVGLFTPLHSGRRPLPSWTDG